MLDPTADQAMWLCPDCSFAWISSVASSPLRPLRRSPPSDLALHLDSIVQQVLPGAGCNHAQVPSSNCRRIKRWLHRCLHRSGNRCFISILQEMCPGGLTPLLHTVLENMRREGALTLLYSSQGVEVLLAVPSWGPCYCFLRLLVCPFSLLQYPLHNIMLPGTTYPPFIGWTNVYFLGTIYFHATGLIIWAQFFVVLFLFFQSRCFLTLPHLPHRKSWFIDPTPTPNSNLGKLSIL